MAGEGDLSLFQPLKAVSYTHLDVYKRQGHEGPPLALDDAYEFFCENLL